MSDAHQLLQQPHRRERKFRTASVVAVLTIATLVFAVFQCGSHHIRQNRYKHDGKIAEKIAAISATSDEGNGLNASAHSIALVSRKRFRLLLESTSSTEDELKALVAQKMVPRGLATDSASVPNAAGGTLVPRQFLHLHHMKTAGTSMDSKLRCAVGRLGKTMSVKVPYYSLHECSQSLYARCKSGKDKICQDRMHQSAVISYCAPLKDLCLFGWDAYESNARRSLESLDAAEVRVPTPEGEADFELEEKEIEVESEKKNDDEDEVERKPIPDQEPAPAENVGSRVPLKSSTVAPYDSITVLRHPVDRVWSMFRFQTRNCYDCRNLTDIYHSLEVGKGNERIDGMCLKQLLNHETTNLLSSSASGDPARQDLSDQEVDDMVREAIHNMQHFFTLVGLTEQLPKTVEMVDVVFPWMAETIKGSDTACPLPHANASPQNNRCGSNYSHMALPDHPDEATTQAIIKHNQLDMKLYEAAVQLFELQWEVYQEGKEAE